MFLTRFNVQPKNTYRPLARMEWTIEWKMLMITACSVSLAMKKYMELARGHQRGRQSSKQREKNIKKAQ